MRIRSKALGAVLGAVLFTAVPAVAAPFTAQACDGSTLCDWYDPGDDDSGGGGAGGGGDWGDPGGDWGDPGGDWGDPGGDGGGGDSGGGDWGDPGDGDWGDPGDGGDNNPVSDGDWSEGGIPDVTSGEIGDPIDATLPTVVITGTATRPSTPSGPGIPTESWNGNPTRPVVALHSRGVVWEERGNCYRNESSSPYKGTQSVSYSVSYQTSVNISAKASELLSSQFNAQLNTSISKTVTHEVNLEPGQTWALYTQYQTNVYAITTFSVFGGYSTEYVNVTGPTGTTTARAC